MTLSHPARWLGPLFLSLLIACGGGGGGGGTTNLAGGGIGGTGISTGPITATGTVAAASLGGAVTVSSVGASAMTVPTITVNSVVFELPGTVVTLNGQTATAGDLRVGQVVTVAFTGDPTTGTATAEAVTYDPNLTAPVEVVDRVHGTITLLGQVVRVENLLGGEDDAGQEIKPTDLINILNTIQPGDLLEISGERDSVGVLHATRIEGKGPSTDPTKPVAVEVEGVVTGLAADHLSFTLGTRRVVIPQELAVDGTLAKGVDVDVEGSLLNDELTATSIEIKGDVLGGQESGSRVEQDGFITAVDRLDTDNEIEVDGVRVRLVTGTEITGEGSVEPTRSDLQLNVEVEVRGTLDTGGVVVAERIKVTVDD